MIDEARKAKIIAAAEEEFGESISAGIGRELGSEVSGQVQGTGQMRVSDVREKCLKSGFAVAQSEVIAQVYADIQKRIDVLEENTTQ